jgi:hypothetical protein
MVSNLLFYQLLLFSLVWLCILLHVLWPYERTEGVSDLLICYP